MGTLDDEAEAGGRAGLGARLASLRAEYARAGLAEADMASAPMAQLERWLGEAIAAGVSEANAVTLATASQDAAPSARVVLLKGIDARGVTFYTNYESAKGRELAGNPRASIVAFWRELERQVRVSGGVVRVSRAESEEYFRSRPRGSQLGAWASAQSSVLTSRAALDAHLEEVTARYAGGDVPLPPFWGGFRLEPRAVEFWQGRPNRLHDRLEYVPGEGGGWSVRRLSP